jgi:sulfatase maturation enzyme AslB (radical SAM superfamily)
MNKIIRIEKVVETFFVYWALTDECNFKCNYCPPFLHSGNYSKLSRPGFPTDEEIETFLDRLISVHLQGRKLSLVFSGGEPTIHPMFPHIVNKAQEWGTTSVLTNGSKDLEWWANLPKLPTYVNISLHHEFTNVRKINELCKFLIEKDNRFFLNLMCDPKNWEGTISIYEQLDDDLKLHVQPKILNLLSTTRDRREYNEEQKQFIQSIQDQFNKFFSSTPVLEMADAAVMMSDSGEIRPIESLAELTLTRRNSFHNWKCSAGSNGIYVGFDGNVWAGICKSKYLGRINNFELLSDYLECPNKFCPNFGDIRLNKYDPTIFE